jgi:hypothetical protein
MARLRVRKRSATSGRPVRIVVATVRDETNSRPVRPEAIKPRGRPAGRHPATVQRGRLIREALESGVPLAYIARAQRSQLTADYDATADAEVVVGRVVSTLSSATKTLRRQLRAADEADGVSTQVRSSSPKVVRAMRRLHGHPGGLVAPGTARTAQDWESAAERLELLIELRRAMAEAAGETVDLSGIERNLERHRSIARRLSEDNRVLP